MIKQLESCEYLYLVDLQEPQDNTLRLVLEEARVQGPEQELDIGGVSFGRVKPIKHGGECRAFELIWENYISYSVLNESYYKPDANSEYEGNLFRQYSKSPFLEYISKESFATESYPGPFRHVAITCENHILNVVSVSEPRIQLLKPGRPYSVHGT